MIFIDQQVSYFIINPVYVVTTSSNYLRISLTTMASPPIYLSLSLPKNYAYLLTLFPFLLRRLPLLEGQRVAVEERGELEPQQRRQPLQLRLAHALDVHAAFLFGPHLERKYQNLKNCL